MNRILLIVSHLFFLASLLIPRASAQLVPDFKVNDSLSLGNNYSPKIGIDGDGNFVIVWRDAGLTYSDIYFQRYSSDYVPQGENILISDTSSYDPSIVVLKNGNFGVCWYNTSGGSRNIKFIIFDRYGVPLSDEIKVNEFPFPHYPVIGADSLGNFIIAWEEVIISGTDLDNEIYFQRFDPNGNKISTNKRVNDDIHHRQQIPDIAVQRSGGFMITWLDDRPPSFQNADDVYTQMYDRNGTKIGVNRRVNQDTDILNPQFTPLISCDSIGRFCILYGSFVINFEESNIYGQLYDENGSEIGNNFVAVDGGENEILRALARKENGDFVIGYEEVLLSERIQYLKRFNSNGTSLGNNFRVTHEAPLIFKRIGGVKIHSNKIYTVWSDDRNENTDIYCNVRSFSNPDTTVNTIKVTNQISQEFKLHQNYPNPFNPITKIRYEIPLLNGPSFITLKIYDVSGKVIDILVNKSQQSGNYTVFWDGSNFPSGIYFCKLESSNVSMHKKLVLIK